LSDLRRTYRVQSIDKFTAPELEAFLKDVAKDPHFTNVVPVKLFKSGTVLILEGTWDDETSTSPAQPAN